MSKQTFKIVAVLLGVLVTLTTIPGVSQPTPVSAQEPSPTAYVPGEVIVKFKPTISVASAQDASTRNSLEKSAGVQISEVRPLLRLPDIQDLENIPILNRYSVVTIPEDADVELIAKKLSDNPGLEFAVPNYFLHIDRSPNDTFFPNQWVLKNDVWANLRFEDAWDITTGSSNVVVAVLDTGFDVSHPDLNPKNTHTGYDFVNDDTGVQDDHGHGTAVAGIIAAESNNGQGVAGVSWGARILPVKVCDRYGDCPTSAIINGITWAASHNARIINMSFGLTFGSGFGELIAQAMQDAVDYAYAESVVIIAGAGNNSERLDAFDATYNVPAELNRVIAVGATNEHDDACVPNDGQTFNNCGWIRTQGSGYGPLLDIMAPGASTIWTTDILGSPGFNNTDYVGSFGGTSAAAPFVSGLVALMLSVDPALTPDQVEDIIKVTAVDKGTPGRDDYYGWGRIDAYAAVYAIPLVVPSLIAPSNDTNVDLRPRFSWSDSPTAEYYEIQISPSSTFNSGVIPGSSSTTYFNPSSDLLSNTTYYWRVRALRGSKSSNWAGPWSFTTSSSGGTACPAPSLVEPANGATVNSRNVTFRWNPISGCSFNGYTLHVCLTDNISGPINCIINKDISDTQHMEPILGWDNRVLYWGVKANAPNALWAQARPFRISIDSVACPQSDGVILYQHWNYDCGGAGANAGYVQRTGPGDYDLGGLGLDEKTSSIHIPSSWSVRLFKESGFRGAEVCLNGDEINFANNNYSNGDALNDSVSSFRVYDCPNCNYDCKQGGVHLCSGTDYKDCMLFTNDARSLGNAGFGNDIAHSIKIIGDWSAVLFADDGYNGTRVVFDGSDSDLGGDPIGYGASSIRVRRRIPAYFTLYDGGDWSGTPFPSDREIDDLGHWNFNDRAKSIRVASGYQAIVCEHDKFHGVCGRTSQDQGDLNSVAGGLHGTASSVRVCAGQCPPAPNIPSLIRPVSGAVLHQGDPIIFQWSGNGDEYQVEVSGGELPSPRRSELIAGTEWSISSLVASSKAYFWRVRAWNGYGMSESGAQSFSITSPSPAGVFLDFTTSLNHRAETEIVLTEPGKYFEPRHRLVEGIVTTDAEGDYRTGLELGGIPPGSYDMYLKPCGYLRIRKPVQLLEGLNSYDFGNFLAGDIDANGQDNLIGVMDLLRVMSAWCSNCQSVADLNRDGNVNINDLLRVLSNWGPGDGWRDPGPFPFDCSATATSTQEPISVQAVEGNITLTPDSGTFNVGDTFNMQVLLSTGSYTSTAVEVTILYDPGVLEVQDTEPMTDGIQFVVNELYDGDHTGAADPSLGEIHINARSGENNYFQGSGTLASINFRGTAAINNTTVEVYFRDGWSSDSNIVDGKTIKDVLGQVSTTSFRTTGSPNRPMPAIAFISPSTNRILNSSAIELEVEASDPYTQVKEVKFEANLNGVWTSIGSDTYGPDGWDFDWDMSQVPDGDREVRATALLLGGEGTTTSRSILLDRTPPTHVSSSVTPLAEPYVGVPVAIEVTAADEHAGVDRIDVYAKKIGSGPAQHRWYFLESIAGSQGSLIWNTSNYSAGSYQITFSIQDKAGNWGPDFQPVLLLGLKGKVFLPVILKNSTGSLPPPPAAPTAAFVATPVSGTAPLTVTFTDQSSGQITGWLWDFGDGNTSTAQNPQHTYSSTDVFTVTLTATGPGGSDTLTKPNYITVTSPLPPPSNLLTNGSFEEGSYAPDAVPAGWTKDAWNWPAATFVWDDTQAYDGNRSIRITHDSANDSRWIQTVAVQPNTNYRLSGWIKTDSVTHSNGSVVAGANLSLNGTWERTVGLFGTNDWTSVSLEFNSGSGTEITIACRLGYWDGTAIGTMWCDDIHLDPL